MRRETDPFEYWHEPPMVSTLHLRQMEEEDHDRYEEVRGNVIKELLPYFEVPAVVQPAPRPPPPPSSNRRHRREDPWAPTPVSHLLSKRAEDNSAEVEVQARHRARAQEISELNVPEELERYLRDDLAHADVDILEWWRLNKNTYPTLARAARDVLAGQSSSAASERAFSKAGQLVVQSRSRLGSEVISAHMYCESWFGFGKMEDKE